LATLAQQLLLGIFSFGSLASRAARTKIASHAARRKLLFGFFCFGFELGIPSSGISGRANGWQIPGEWLANTGGMARGAC